MAENIEELYSNLTSDERFKSLYPTQEEFEKSLQNDPTIDSSLEQLFGVKSASEYLKKKDQSIIQNLGEENSFSLSPLDGQTEQVPQQIQPMVEQPQEGGEQNVGVVEDPYGLQAASLPPLGYGKSLEGGPQPTKPDPSQNWRMSLDNQIKTAREKNDLNSLFYLLRDINNNLTYSTEFKNFYGQGKFKEQIDQINGIVANLYEKNPSSFGDKAFRDNLTKLGIVDPVTAKPALLQEAKAKNIPTFLPKQPGAPFIQKPLEQRIKEVNTPAPLTDLEKGVVEYLGAYDQQQNAFGYDIGILANQNADPFYSMDPALKAEVLTDNEKKFDKLIEGSVKSAMEKAMYNLPSNFFDNPAILKNKIEVDGGRVITETTVNPNRKLLFDDGLYMLDDAGNPKVNPVYISNYVDRMLKMPGGLISDKVLEGFNAQRQQFGLDPYTKDDVAKILKPRYERLAKISADQKLESTIVEQRLSDLNVFEEDVQKVDRNLNNDVIDLTKKSQKLINDYKIEVVEESKGEVNRLFEDTKKLNETLYNDYLLKAQNAASPELQQMEYQKYVQQVNANATAYEEQVAALNKNTEEKFKNYALEIENTSLQELEAIKKKYGVVSDKDENGKLTTAAYRKYKEAYKTEYNKYKAEEKANSDAMGWRLGDIVQSGSARIFANAIQSLSAATGYENNPATDLLKYLDFVQTKSAVSIRPFSEVLETDGLFSTEALKAAVQSTVQQGPNLMTGIAATALSGNPYVGGSLMWAYETTDQVGQNYRDVFSRTGSILQAENAAVETLQTQILMAPIYSVSMLPFTKGFLSKYAGGTGAWGFTKKFGLGLALEASEEIPVEIGQGYLQYKFGTDNPENFSTWLSKNGGNTALDVLPSIAVLGGGSAGMETYRERMTEQAKNRVLATLGRLGMSQTIADAAQVIGTNGVNILPEYLYRTNQIDAQELKDMKRAFGEVVKALPQAQELVRDQDAQKYFVSLASEKAAKQKQMEESKDEAQKKRLEEVIATIDKKMTDVATGKPLKLTKITFKDGGSIVIENQEMVSYLKNKDFLDLVSDGSIQVNTQDTEINRIVEDKKKELEAKIQSATDAGAKNLTALNTDARKIGATINDGDKLTLIAQNATENGQKNTDRILEEATTLQNALNQVAPGTNIVFMNNSEYQTLMDKVKGKKSSAGNFSYAKNNDGTYSVEIQINLDKANDTTTAHEVGHAILLATLGSNPELFNQMRVQLKRVVETNIGNKALASIDALVQKYSNVEKGEEFLVELAATLRQNEKNLEIGTLEKIAKVISDFVARMTGGRIQLFDKISTRVDFTNFINGMADTLRTGELSQTLKDKINAVQEQTAGQVPVQSEAGVGQEMVEGEPQAEPQGVTEEGQKQSQEVATEIEQLAQESFDEPGSVMNGDILSKSQVGADSVISDINAQFVYDDTNLPDGFQMPEFTEIEDVLEKSGGAAIFINSDGTKVGIARNGKKLQGGWRYLYFTQNINDKIGFAATSETHVNTFYKLMSELTAIRDKNNPEMSGKPVAVFVTIQNGDSMLGEWYAGEFFMDGIDEAITQKKFKGGIREARNLLLNALAFTQDIKDLKGKLKLKQNEFKSNPSDQLKKDIKGLENTIKNKEEIANSKNNKQLIELINSSEFETHEGRLRIAEKFASKDFSFKGRVSFLKTVIPLKSVTGGANREIKKALQEVGYDRKAFYEEFLDEALLEKLKASDFDEKSIGGVTMGGFYADPNVSQEEFFANKTNGIQHAMFNESFSSNGETFRLPKAYSVNKISPTMGFPVDSAYEIYNKANGTNFTKKNVTLEDKHNISKWLFDNGRADLIYDPFTSISGTMYTSFVDTDYQNIDEIMSKSQAVRSEKSSGTTQVATTTGSYVKAANLIKDIKGDVLDYGAGLGLGTDAMSNTLGRKVDSFEPNPERWQGNEPATFTTSDQINKKYDGIVSLNVLNVVPKDIRDAIVLDIFDKLNEGGKAIISTRGWVGDVNAAKNAIPGPEEKSLIITRRQGGETVEVFQKGFDANELVDYVQELLGNQASVVKNNTFGKSGVIITKNTQAQSPIQSKSQLDFSQIGPEYDAALQQNNGDKVAAFTAVIEKGYTPKRIKEAIGLFNFDENAFKQAQSNIAIRTLDTIGTAFSDRQELIKEEINNNLGNIEAIYEDLIQQGYSNLEIFTAARDMDYLSPQDLIDIFGAQYRETVQKAIDTKTEYPADFLDELEEDARTLKVSQKAAQISDVIRETGIGMVDSAIAVDSLLEYLKENGFDQIAIALTEAVKQFGKDRGNFEKGMDWVDQVKSGQMGDKLYTPEAINYAFSVSSELFSQAGRILQLARYFNETNQMALIERQLNQSGVVLTEAQKKTLEALVNDYKAAQKDNKEKLKALEEDWSDQAYEAFNESEKAVGMATIKVAQFLEARKPIFWNERLTSGAARALLGVTTTILSFTSNIENNIWSTNYAARAIQKLRDSLGNGIKGNTLSFSNWKMARKLTSKRMWFDMNTNAKFGVMDTSKGLNRYYDNLAQVNFFKDAIWASKFMSAMVKKIFNKDFSSMTPEEQADAYDMTLVKLRDGSIELRDGKTYTFARSLAWTLGTGPALAATTGNVSLLKNTGGPLFSELTGRIMSYGGDIAFGYMAAQRAMIDYFQNIQGTRYQDGVFGDMLTNADGKLDEKTIRALSEILRADAELYARFEQEGLKRTLLGDNIISGLISLGRGGIRKKIRSLYTENRKEIGGSTLIAEARRELLSGRGLAKTTLQMVDVGLFTLMPFTKVPVNFLGSAIAKVIPYISGPKYVISEGIYQYKNNEFNKKYPIGTKLKTEKERRDYEKAKIDLFSAKRQATYDSAQFVTSLAIYGFAMSAVQAGAILMADKDDEDKDKSLKQFGLRGGLYNASLHWEYIFAGMPSNFLARRGGFAKEGDVILNTNNAGFLGYAMGLYSTVYNSQRKQEADNVMSLFNTQKSAISTLVSSSLSSGIENLPMFQGLARIGEVLNDVKKDKTGKSAFTNFMSGSLSTSMAVFFPSFFSFMSKGNAEMVQSAGEITVRAENPSWPIYFNDVTLRVVQKLNRNVSFENTRNEFYEAQIGPFGEDLGYKVTLAEPGTGLAYLQAFIDPFSIRSFSNPVKEEQKEIQKYRESVDLFGSMTNLALVYEQMTGRPYEWKRDGKTTSFFNVISNPMPNQFDFTDSVFIRGGADASNIYKQFTYQLPNDLYRQELKIRGEYMRTSLRQYATDFRNAMAIVQTAVEENRIEDAKRAIVNAFEAYENAISAANTSYKKDYKNQREKRYLIEMKKRNLFTAEELEMFKTVGLANSSGLIL